MSPPLAFTFPELPQRSCILFYKIFLSVKKTAGGEATATMGGEGNSDCRGGEPRQQARQARPRALQRNKMAQAGIRCNAATNGNKMSIVINNSIAVRAINGNQLPEGAVAGKPSRGIATALAPQIPNVGKVSDLVRHKNGEAVFCAKRKGRSPQITRIMIFPRAKRIAPLKRCHCPSEFKKPWCYHSKFCAQNRRKKLTLKCRSRYHLRHEI